MKNRASLKQIVLMGAAGLGLFGATQAANAQSTFQNYKQEISGVTNIFGYNGITYGLWPDKKITSDQGKTYFLKENKWVSDSGEVMPLEFNKELEKSASAINSKAKENNSRIVDYFNFFHAPSKQKNTIVVYSDGTAALGNFFYDLDKQGAFYDENNNGKRDSKEQAMSESFTKLYYEKLKNLANKQGMPSKWIFPPLSEKERLAIALQAEDYEDLLSHEESKTKNQNPSDSSSSLYNSNITTEIDGVKVEIQELGKKYDEKFKLLDKEIDLLKVAKNQQTNFYDDSELKELVGKQGEAIKKNSEKLGELESKLTQGTTTEKVVENNYDDTKVKGDITSLYKEIEDLKAALIGVSALNQSTQNTVYSNLEGKIKALDEKISGLEKTTDSVKGNATQYDDSQIKQDISQIKQQLEVLKPLEGLASVVKQIDQEDAQASKSQTQEQAKPQVTEATQTPQQTSQAQQQVQTQEQAKPQVTESQTKISPIEGISQEEFNKNYRAKSIIIRKPGLSFNVGPEFYFNSNIIDGAALNLGIRYDVDKVFGLGVNASIGGSPNKLVESYAEAPSLLTGRYAQGTINNTNRLNFGFGGEVRFGPVILGAGGDFESGIRSTLEQIMKDGVELRSNTSAINYFLNRAKFYAGLDILLSQTLGIKVYGGVLDNLDLNDPNRYNFYGGINATIKLGEKNDKIVEYVKIDPEDQQNDSSKVQVNKRIQKGDRD